MTFDQDVSILTSTTASAGELSQGVPQGIGIKRNQQTYRALDG